MFDHCLYFNTTALARQLEREWAEAFKPFDLTPPQAFLLRVVLAQPGSLQREIADRMVITRPTATRALDTLEEKGFIERRATANDGREWAIHPTRAALDIERDLNQASRAVTTKFKALLGAEEFSSTVDRVRAVRSALS